MAYQSINPDDGKVLQSFPDLDDDQQEVALVTAAAAFESWRQTSLAERAAHAAVKAKSFPMKAGGDSFVSRLNRSSGATP